MVKPRGPPSEKFAPCVTDQLAGMRMNIGSSELREAVADGPVLFRGIENGHEHILRA
jgi:hypothetical protein